MMNASGLKYSRENIFYLSPLPDFYQLPLRLIKSRCFSK